MKTSHLLRSLAAYTALAVLILVFVTCKKKDDETPPQTTGFVIAPNAKFIVDNDWTSLLTHVDSSNFTLTFNNALMSRYSLTQGNLIVSSAGNGLLRKIDVISQSGDQVQIQTSQATLTDLIQQGDIDFKSSLTVSKIKSIKYYYPGIYLDTARVKSTDGTLLNWDINTEIYPQIILQGNFQYTSDFVLQIQMSILQGLKKVKFGFEGTEEFNLALIAGKQFSLSKEITLATVHFSPFFIPLPVPPFTIVVAPVFDIKLGVNGYANANISTSLNQNFTFETGIQYLKDNGWSSYMNYDKSFTFTPPQLNMNAGAEVFLKPELRMLVYNLVGPYLNAKGYGKIEADLAQTPWWKVYYGVKMSAGAKATILGAVLFDYNVGDLLNWEQQVGQASESNSAPNTPLNPSPANNATDVSISTSLSWTCSDPDQDPVTYDVYFGTSSSPPLMTSNITTTTFSLASLITNKTYYWKIVAKDDHGHSVPSDVWSFTTADNVGPTIPAVTTAPITLVTKTSATSGGEVTSDGGATVTAKGICWSISANPTTLNNPISGGSGTGSFSCNITGLSPGTTYHVRAYATNSVGTAYGVDVQFTTSDSVPQPCPGVPTVTYEGQTYNTVKIGTQCWLKENLNIGTRIIGSQNQIATNGIKEKYCYNDLESNCDIFGGLYQWDEMMQGSTTPGVQGICPSGWHVPTNAEFTTLTSFLGGENVAGGKMKEAGTAHWSAPNTGATNESGFTALPGGFRSNGLFYELNGKGYFRSSSQADPTNAVYRYLDRNFEKVYSLTSYKSYGLSVRCVKD